MVNEIPVYMITGFLEGGKTSFLKFTLQQDYFNDGSKTLLLLCEEGEAEFEADFLKKYNCVCEIVEEKEQLNREFFREMGKKHRPERVIIEYNGMWSPKEIQTIEFPYSWELYQTITVLDGSTFQLYVNNIKSLAMELLTYTDMVIFNRCDENTPVESFNRSLKAVNRNAEVMFEDKNGDTIEPPVILPYDIEQDEIVLADEDYGIWYIDVQDHPENYKGKTIKFKAMAMKSKDFPDGMFVPGRNIMTCCENDIRFLGFICRYEGIKNIKRRQWVYVTAEMKWEYSSVYEEEGPVLYAKEVALTSAPKVETVTF
jgi:G3E family GTPase